MCTLTIGSLKEVDILEESYLMRKVLDAIEQSLVFLIFEYCVTKYAFGV